MDVYSGAEESEDENVEWEEAKDELEEEEEEEEQKVDWDAINAELNAAAQKDVPKEKPKKTRKFSTAELQAQHQLHLICLLSREKQIHDSICNDQTIQAQMLSKVPFELVQSSSDNLMGLSYLTRLTHWFHQQSQPIPITNSSTFDMPPADKLVTFEGYEFHLATLFVTLCRALGFKTRYTCALDARHLHMAKHQVQCFDQNVEAVAARVWGSSSSTEQQLAPSTKKRKRTAAASSRVWAEVYCQNQWMHVNPMRNLVNEPHEIERSRKRGQYMTYVISIEQCGRIVDVTRRYACCWSKNVGYEIAVSCHSLVGSLLARCQSCCQSVE